MTYPIFHEGETCLAHFPTSTGSQFTECDVTGILPRGEGRYAYRVLLLGATRDCVFEQGDLKKNWAKQRCDWGMLRGIWQPDRQKRVADAASGWEELKEVAKKDPYRFHRQIGQDAIDSLKKLYDDSQKARRSKSWKEFK